MVRHGRPFFPIVPILLLSVKTGVLPFGRTQGYPGVRREGTANEIWHAENG